MPIFEQLEPRILLSADLIPLPVDADPIVTAEPIDETVQNPTDSTTESDTTVISTEPAQTSADEIVGDSETNEAIDSESDPSQTAVDPPADKTSSQEFIFINDDIEGFEELRQDLEEQENSEVVILSSEEDGLTQINTALSDSEDIGALHFFTHGNDSTVKVGSSWLNSSNLTENKDSISSWGEHLTEEGDILFYGCDLAATQEGEDFIDEIAELTGADVAASVDPTGHLTKGADWILEYETGEIETIVPVSLELQSDWVHILAEETIADNFDSGDYSGSSGTVGWGEDGAGNDYVWIEIGDDGEASSGEVQITGDSLLIKPAASDDTMRGISRVVDLTDAASAYLSFDIDDKWGGTVSVEIREGGGTWSTLYDDKIVWYTDATRLRFDITDYISATTEIRFVSEGTDYGGSSSSAYSQATFNVDNLNIDYTTNTWSSALWFSTEKDVSKGGQTGIEDWTEEDLISLDNSGPIFGNNTDGDFSMAAQLRDLLNKDFNIRSLHYVTTEMVIGDQELNVGDILFSVDKDISDFFSDPDAPGTDIDVKDSDIILFTLDNTDYSSGTFSIFLTDATDKKINGITLVESKVTVGDRVLEAGDILLTHDGGSEHSDIFHLTKNEETVGNVTTVTYSSSVLLEGSDTDVGIGEKITGIDLVERTTTIGNTTLQEGTLLLSVDSNIDSTDWPSALNVNDNDIFALKVTKASSADGTTANRGQVSASMFFDGSDVSFDTKDEEFDAFSLTVQGINEAPTITTLASSESYTEDTAHAISDIVITDSDAGSTYQVTLDLSDNSAGILSATNSGTATNTFAAGTLTISGSDIDDVNAVLATTIFTPASNYNSDFTITISATDGINPATAKTKTLNGIAVNDAPTITTLTSSDNYTEDTTHAISDIVITDSDGGSTYQVSLDLSDNLAGTLSETSIGTATGTFSAGVLTISGSDIDDVNAVLAATIFTPASNYNDDFTIAISATDGINPATAKTKTLNGISVNDAPTITTLASSESYTEDTTHALSDIAIVDSDGGTTYQVWLDLSDDFAGTLSETSIGTATGIFAGSTLSITGTDVNDVNAVLAATIFTPASNYNDDFTITITANDGINPAIATTKTLNGIAINDAPTINNPTPNDSYTEDTAYAISDITIADTDGGSTYQVTLDLSDNLAGTLSETSIGSATGTFAGGTLTISGTDIDDINAVLATTIFSPASNYNDNFTISITATDGINPATATTKTLNGISVNDAPTITTLAPSESYTEDTPHAISDIVIADADGGTTYQVTLDLSDNSAGALSATNMGTATSTFATGTLTISGSNIDDVNAVLATTIFTPTMDYTDAFTIAIAATDGTNPATTKTKSLIANSTNDAPTITNPTPNDSYTEDTDLAISDIFITDADSGSTYQVSLDLSDDLAGTLSVTSIGSATGIFVDGTLTISGADINDVNAVLATTIFTPESNYNDDFTISITATDGINPAIAATRTLNGISVNDAPTISTLTSSDSYTEDTNLAIPDIVIADADGGSTYQVTLDLSDDLAGTLSENIIGTATGNFAGGTLTISGTDIDDVNAVLAATIFTPASDYNDDFTIAIAATDGIDPATATTKTLNGIAVNDAPTISTVTASDNYTEDTTQAISDIVIADVDGSTSYQVSLDLSDDSAGTLSETIIGTATGTFVDGTLTISGSDINDVNAVLAATEFTPANNYNDNFTIAISATDGITPATSTTKTLNGISVNDAPTITTLSPSDSYTEDTDLAISDIVIADTDGGSTYQVTLDLSDDAAGVLSETSIGSATGTFVDGTLTISGSDINDVNAVLATTIFTPASNYNNDFTIAIAASDGINPATATTKALTGIAVNDAPTISTLTASDNYTEDTTQAISDIVIADVDGGTSYQVSLDLSDNLAGTLSETSIGTATGTFVDGTLTISGSNINDVNAVLAATTFTPASNYNDDFTIAIAASDGIDPATATTKTLNGIAVNDAPTITTLASNEPYTEDTPYALSSIVIADADDGTTYQVTLDLSDDLAGTLSETTSGTATSTFTAGTLTISGSNINDINSVLATTVFTPEGNYNDDFTITIAATDGINPAITKTTSLHGIAVNDAPTISTLTASDSYTEDTIHAISDIVIADIDGGTNYEVTLDLSDDSAGTLSETTSGSATGTFTGGTLTVSGTDINDVNAVLAATIFTPESNYNGDFTITIAATDGINPATATTKTLNGIAINDAPTASPVTQSGTYTEDMVYDIDDIVVSDVDQNETISAQMTLSSPGFGTLSTAGGASYDATSGIWSISGTVTEVNNALSLVSFNPTADSFQDTTIAVQIEDGKEDGVTALSGTINLTGTAVADAPLVSDVATFAATPSEPIYITTNSADGAEVTHFQITEIVNGELYLSDGLTSVVEDDFISISDGTAGLIFTPSSDDSGSFKVTGSADGLTVASESPVSTSTVSVSTIDVTETTPERGSSEVEAPESEEGSGEGGTPDTGGESLGEELTVIEEISGIDETLELVAGLETGAGDADPQSEDSSSPDAEETTKETDDVSDGDSSGEEDADNSLSYVNAQKIQESSSATELFDIAATFDSLTFDMSFESASVHSFSLSSSSSQTIKSDSLSLTADPEENEIYSTSNYNLLDLEYRDRSFEEYQSVRRSLENFREQTEQEASIEKTVVGSAIAASTGLSAGYVIWLLRSGALLSSILSSLPAWQLADPLAVLAGAKGADEEDDDSIESIIEKGAHQPTPEEKAQHPPKNSIGSESVK